jgi:group II intron reverse transcriptase/maturase
VDQLKSPAKPFDISKWAVWKAWEKVKANKGAPGVDGVAIEEFERDLKGNLYKIWNRMSSGSYFPPPVRAVEIPKPHGRGTRVLGVPTVVDRVAQTVVAQMLEERAERLFHPDSFGYRPGRSALDAVTACRQRCWKTDWVIDLDIQKFFDSVPWSLVVKAVEAVCDLPWVKLYVTRWLQAPLVTADGTVRARDRGTPQGSAVSPVLANLFLHFAFDTWLVRTFPTVAFERYVDDAVIHCVNEAEAHAVLAALGERMNQVGAAPGQDQDRVLQGWQAARFARAHVVHLPRVHVPGAAGAGEVGESVHRLQPGDQQGRHEQDQCAGAVMATAPANRSLRRRARTMDQPDRARLDAVLRGVLSLRAVSAPATHQRLPDAVAAQQVRTVEDAQTVQPGVETGHRQAAQVLRALALGQRRPAGPLTRATRAV